MRRGRKLTREEAELWQRVSRGLDHVALQRDLDATSPEELRSTNPDIPSPPARQVPRPRKSPPDPVTVDTARPAPGSGMDRRSFDRLRRGRIRIDARIDLHGMTTAQAHPKLRAFVMRNAAAGHRLLLVITGKGRGARDDGPIPAERGILRRQVPQWLSTPPLSALVLEILPAARQHGGDGAYYVYLRRR